MLRWYVIDHNGVILSVHSKDWRPRFGVILGYISDEELPVGSKYPDRCYYCGRCSDSLIQLLWGKKAHSDCHAKTRAPYHAWSTKSAMAKRYTTPGIRKLGALP